MAVSPKKYAHQNHIFLDPEDCGSSVGYYLSMSSNTPKGKKTVYSFSGTVVLEDCTRKIDWYFSQNDTKKIDNAIRILQEFRKELVDLKKTVTKLNKE